MTRIVYTEYATIVASTAAACGAPNRRTGPPTEETPDGRPGLNLRAACSEGFGQEPPSGRFSGSGARSPWLGATPACSQGQRADNTMLAEPDGLEEQGEARVSSQPAPDWTAQDEEHAWDIFRAALVAGLDHPEVDLGPTGLPSVSWS